MLFSNFCGKEVVAVDTGVRLGTIDDLVFEEKSRSISGFYIYGRPRWLCGEKLAQDLYIAACDVVTIGEDIILVSAYSSAGDVSGRKNRLFF